MPLKVKQKFISEGMATDQEMVDASVADRDRSNHTGTQPSSTISDFASAVRTTLLEGLSLTSNLVVSASDTVLSALGKIQAQIEILKGGSNQVYNSSATHEVQSNATGYVIIPDSQVLGPVSGKYVVMGNVSCRHTANNSTISIAVFCGGILVEGTEVTLRRENSDVLLPYTMNWEVTVDGTKDVELRWKQTGGTARAFARALTMIKVGTAT